MSPAFSLLDRGLVLLRELSPEYADELSDHTPMVLEALDRLGFPEAIQPFLDKTLPKLRALGSEPEPGLRGYAELLEQARRDLHETTPRLTLAKWFPRFGPGLSGAAFHGLIRVAHALRSIERASADRDPRTDPRREELAKALAYATVRAAPLPVEPARIEERLAIGDALLALAPSPDALTARHGLISTALAERAGNHGSLARTAAALDLGPDPQAALRELRSRAIELFVASEYLARNTFTMLHVVTAMEAASTLGQALPEADQAALARHTAHALLAARVAFVGRAKLVRAPVDTPESFEALVERAVDSLDDHSIKLAAALSVQEGQTPVPQRTEALAHWLASRTATL